MTTPPYSHHRASDKEAGITVYLMEELGDARMRCDQLVRYIADAGKLVDDSPHKDHLFEVAGHLIHAIPDTLFKLQKSLQAVALAAGRLDYEELKQELRPEKVEQLERVLKDVRIRYVQRRSEPQAPQEVVQQLRTLAAQSRTSGESPQAGLIEVILGLGSTTKLASDLGVADVLEKLAAVLEGGSPPSKQVLTATLRRVLGDTQIETIEGPPMSKFSVDLQSKFEKDKPADPTENMSTEQKAEWEKQKELNKDNFKKAAWKIDAAKKEPSFEKGDTVRPSKSYLRSLGPTTDIKNGLVKGKSGRFYMVQWNTHDEATAVAPAALEIDPRHRKKAAGKGPVTQVALKWWNQLHDLESELEGVAHQYSNASSYRGSPGQRDAKGMADLINGAVRQLEAFTKGTMDHMVRGERDFVGKYGSPEDYADAQSREMFPRAAAWKVDAADVNVGRLERMIDNTEAQLKEMKSALGLYKKDAGKYAKQLDNFASAVSSIQSTAKMAQRVLGKKSASDDDKLSRFEEGKPADPTENMSTEDAKEWKENTEKYKDKLKAASWKIDKVATKAKLFRGMSSSEMATALNIIATEMYAARQGPRRLAELLKDAEEGYYLGSGTFSEDDGLPFGNKNGPKLVQLAESLQKDIRKWDFAAGPTGIAGSLERMARMLK